MKTGWQIVGAVDQTKIATDGGYYGLMEPL